MDYFPCDVNRHDLIDFIYPEKGFIELNPAESPNGKK